MFLPDTFAGGVISLSKWHEQRAGSGQSNCTFWTRPVVPHRATTDHCMDGEPAAAVNAHRLAQDKLNASQAALVVVRLKQKSLALEEEARLARVALVDAEKEAAEKAAATAKTSLKEKAASVELMVAATVEVDPRVWKTITDAPYSDTYLDVSAKNFLWWVHHCI